MKNQRAPTATELEIIKKIESAKADLINIDADCGGAVDLQGVIDQLENIIRKLNSPL